MSLDDPAPPDEAQVMAAMLYFFDVARAAIARAADGDDGLEFARALVDDIELSRVCLAATAAADSGSSDANELLDAAIARGLDRPPVTSQSLLDLVHVLDRRGKSTEIVALVEGRDLNPLDPQVMAGLGPVLSRAGATDTGRQLSLSAAMQFLERDDSEASAEALREAIAAEPDVLEIRLAYGKVLSAQRQYEEARVVLEAIVEQDPDNADAWADLAEVLRSLARHDEALAALDEAVRLGRDDAWIRGTRGQVLSALDKDAEALVELDSVATPDAPLWVHVARAEVLLALKRPDDAIAAYTIAAASSPSAILPLIERGKVEYDLDRYEAVLVTCEEAAARDPSDLDMLGLRALALVMTERFHEALGTLNRAITLDPSPFRLLQRARVNYVLGQSQDARADLDRAAELEPPDANTLGLTAAVDLSLGEAQTSLEAADAALALEPEQPIALTMKADALASLGRHDEALDVADIALPLVADDPWLFSRVHTVRAEVFLVQKRFDEAIDQAREVLDRDPTFYRARLVWMQALDAQQEWASILDLVAPYLDDATTHSFASWRVYALRRLGRFEEALSEADTVLAGQPEDDETQWERLQALSGLARWEEVRRDSEAALADEELAGRSQFELLHASALVGLGQNDDALDEFDLLIAANPEYVEPAIRKIGILRDLERADDALAAADTALEAHDENAELWYLRGLALYDQGRAEDALVSVEASIMRDPSVATVHGMRGKLLREAGNDEAALEAYERACALDPRVSALQENRAELLRLDGRYIDALNALDIALELSPDSEYALGTRGQVLGALGRYDEAVEALTRAAVLSRRSGAEPDAWIQEDLASNLSSAGRHQEALDTLDECAKYEALSTFARRLRGELLRVLWRMDEALADAEALIAEDPQDEIALGTKAQVMLDMGAPLEALTVLDQLFTVNFESDFGRRTQISALSWVNRYRDALAVLDEHFADDEPDAWTAMAEAQLRQGVQEHAVAIKILEGREEAMCLAPLGLSLARTGDIRGAIDALEVAVEDQAAEAWWFAELGDAYVHRDGRAGDDARHVFAHGAGLADELETPRPLVELDTAYCTFRLGELWSARAKYEAVVGSRPFLVWERLMLGMILTLQGDEAAAAMLAAAREAVDALEDAERAKGLRSELAWAIELMVVDGTIAKDHPLTTGELGTWARAGRRQEARRG